jgi:DNA-binding MarR family transcriptional regulator
VARRLGITRQAVQRIAGLLQTGKLITIEPNPDHERSSLLRLTDLGRDALVSITEEARRWHGRVAAEVAPDDLAITRRVLRVLIAVSG